MKSSLRWRSLAEAVGLLLDAELPALPVIGADNRVVGVFGERDVIRALFPGYVDQLRYAGFVNRSLEEQLERRSSCATEPVSRYMTTEHVEVAGDVSDLQLAETFLHHRVAVLPVVDDGLLVGVITRRDFVGELARRFLQAS